MLLRLSILAAILILMQQANIASEETVNGNTDEISSLRENDSLIQNHSDHSSDTKTISGTKDPQIVKHRFNHREQVIVGGVVMACIALVLVSMNNYNPK